MKFKPLKIFFLLVLLSVLISFVVDPKAPESQYYVGVTRPLVIAHQGGDGLWAGNTMYAFDKAVEIGADVLEMDAHITKDGENILIHDESVDRTTDGTGLIEELTLAEIQQLDAAYKWTNDEGQTFPFRGQGIQVPTLNGLFEKYPDMRYLIEIKLTKNPIDKPFCNLIRASTANKPKGSPAMPQYKDPARSLQSQDWQRCQRQEKPHCQPTERHLRWWLPLDRGRPFAKTAKLR